MALNPDFTQQTTRTLPFCLGWNLVRGSEVNSIFGLSNISPAVAEELAEGYYQAPAEVQQYILADGEWDSMFMFVAAALEQLTGTDTFVGGIPLSRANPAIKASTIQSIANRPLYVHFHGGAFATKGMPNNLISDGPDQATDTWLNYFPTITPALPFSGYAYYLLRQPPKTDGTAPSPEPKGIYRTTRCRIFDVNGNVTGYGFTCNPTWQMIETVLRFHLKPQQPALAGLTTSEKACFDWPAMVAHAARNAYILPNGQPRFTGHFAFAAETSLGAMMETQLRNCLSFRRVRAGKLSFVGEEAKTSVFTFSRGNMVGGSLKLEKKDLTNAPNVYVPQYRDLGVPALVAVASVTTVAPAASGEYYTSLFTTLGPQPFGPNDYFVYGGGTDDADFAGLYDAGQSGITIHGTIYPIIYDVPDQVPATGAPQKVASATGGYLGSLNSRFQTRAPECVQHRSSQNSAAQVAPGITPVARQQKVFYDLGNNTFDQTNRIMKFLMARDLGSDGPGWQAPFKGSIAGFLEAIDVNGAALLEVEPGDLITIDSTADPTFARVYEVVDPLTTYAPTVTSAQDGSEAKRELSIQTYNPVAFTDVSDNPGDSFQTVPGNDLAMADLLPANTPFWLLECTPQAAYDGAHGTITITDCTIQWMG